MGTIGLSDVVVRILRHPSIKGGRSTKLCTPFKWCGSSCGDIRFFSLRNSTVEEQQCVIRFVAPSELIKYLAVPHLSNFVVGKPWCACLQALLCQLDEAHDCVLLFFFTLRCPRMLTTTSYFPNASFDVSLFYVKAVYSNFNRFGC